MNRTDVWDATARRKLVTGLAFTAGLAVAGALVCALLLGTRRSVSLHSTCDAVEAFASLALATLLLLLRRSSMAYADRYLFPASGLIALGVLGLFHAAVPVGKAFVWTRTCASFAGGLGFALSIVPTRFARSRRADLVPVLSFGAALAIGVLSVVFDDRLPAMVRADGSFTAASVVLRFVSSALFLVAFARYIVRGEGARYEVAGFAGFCLLEAVGAILVPLSRIWGPIWWSWHTLELIAAVVLLAIALQLYARLQSDLRRALAARDDFLAMAAHELRTPLAAMRLQADATVKTLRNDQAQSAAALARMGKLLGQLDRLAALVDALLVVARARTGTLALSRQRADLSELVDRALERVGTRLTAAHCAVETHLERGVRGDWDVDSIAQVLASLLENAKTFGAGNPIRIDVSRTDGRAKLAVHDAGVGIAPQDQRRIFERFERAASPRTCGGLGLGLYLAKEIVEAHGGRIWVESEPGAGATFVVELPCEQAEEASRAADGTGKARIPPQSLRQAT